MSLASHLTSLQSKHASLEDSIRSEQQRPQPDSLALQKMKKDKLQIKEQIVHTQDSLDA